MKSREEKISAVRRLLLKYCDPRPEFDGIMTYEIANMIVNETEDQTPKFRDAGMLSASAIIEPWGVPVNVNADTIVRVTAGGAVRYNTYYEDSKTGLRPGDQFNPKLWELMMIWGPAMNMSSAPLFENNEIVIRRGDLKL